MNDNPARDGLAIYSDRGAPVVAVNDGRIERIGHTRKHGHYVVLRDVYGNEYTYAGLGQGRRPLPGPEEEPGPLGQRGQGRLGQRRAPARRSSASRARSRTPARGRSKAAGGLEQMFDARAKSGGDFQTYGHVFTPGLGLNSKNATLRELKPGSRVIGGTVLGRVGRPEPKKAAHMNFMIRPAGKGAPRIDPKPILDGWKLLESTAIYRAKGKNVLKDGSSASIGQILMMPKPLLERRVLNDERIVLSTRAAAATSGPARSTAACSPCWPTSPSPACADGQLAEAPTTAPTRSPATSRTTRRATRSTSPRSTASRSSATRSAAA